MVEASGKSGGVRGAGFLSLGPSNVMVSAGGDTDIMSHWSTQASSAWIPKRVSQPVENHPVISTGYVKNFPHVESPKKEGKDPYMSSYRLTHESTLQSRRNTAVSRIATAERRPPGGFASSSKTSPFCVSPTSRRNLLQISPKRLKDPVEDENDRLGPKQYSTSSTEAWLHPRDMELKASKTRSIGSPESRGIGSPGSMSSGAGQKLASRGSTSTGWKENNTSAEHPWAHPGEEGMSSTYREENKPNALMQAVSGYSQESSTALPTCPSGFIRAGRGVPLGTAMLDPYEKMSSTHLAYMQGRIAPMDGLVAEVAPRLPGSRSQLGTTGFVKNISKGGIILPPPSSPYTTWTAQDAYRTTTSVSFDHPGLRTSYQSGESAVVPSAGLSSSFARSVAPVDRLAESYVDIQRLHPSVALLLTRRDPYYYNTATFKVTSEPR